MGSGLPRAAPPTDVLRGRSATVSRAGRHAEGTSAKGRAVGTALALATRRARGCGITANRLPLGTPRADAIAVAGAAHQLARAGIGSGWATVRRRADPIDTVVDPAARLAARSAVVEMDPGVDAHTVAATDPAPAHDTACAAAHGIEGCIETRAVAAGASRGAGWTALIRATVAGVPIAAGWLTASFATRFSSCAGVAAGAAVPRISGQVRTRLFAGAVAGPTPAFPFFAARTRATVPRLATRLSGLLAASFGSTILAQDYCCHRAPKQGQRAAPRGARG